MTRRARNSISIRDIKRFLQNIPEDRKVVADGLFKKLEYLNKLLQKLEAEIDGGDLSAATVKSYNDTVQRYGIICKQLVSMLPKAAESAENDPLINFIKDGQK